MIHLFALALTTSKAFSAKTTSLADLATMLRARLASLSFSTRGGMIRKQFVSRGRPVLFRYLLKKRKRRNHQTLSKTYEIKDVF